MLVFVLFCFFSFCWMLSRQCVYGKRFGSGPCNVVISGLAGVYTAGGLDGRGNFTKQSHLQHTPTFLCVGPDNDIYRHSCAHTTSQKFGIFFFFPLHYFLHCGDSEDINYISRMCVAKKTCLNDSICFI